MENITSIMISSGEALILGLCVPNFYRPLVMSGKSHRKEIAMSRYFTYTIVEVLPKDTLLKDRQRRMVSIQPMSVQISGLQHTVIISF